MPSFFIPDESWQDSTEVILSGKDVHHITSVLRKSKGDRILLFDSKKRNWIGTITEFSKEKLHVKLTQEEQRTNLTKLDITLVQAIPRPGKMDFIIEKTTEIGVSNIVPLLSQRSWKWTKSRQENRLERWKKKAYEAGKQTGNTIPNIEQPSTISEYIARLSETDRGIVLWEMEKKASFKSVLEKMNCKTRSGGIHIVIGPEGGFDKTEVSLMVNNGFHAAMLPLPVVRVETAAIAALAILNYALGDTN